MADLKHLDHIAGLAWGEPPAAAPLTPDVRSGATFPFSAVSGNADDPLPPFQVIWIYKVTDRKEFAQAVSAFENTLGNPPGIVPGQLAYRGTYTVSISSAAPTFEYRTVWSLGSLADLQVLNDLLANTGSSGNAKLQAMLKLIDRETPMHTEIVGRTKFAVV